MKLIPGKRIAIFTNWNERPPTTPMNEWGFIRQDTLVALGKSATINKFKLAVAR